MNDTGRKFGKKERDLDLRRFGFEVEKWNVNTEVYSVNVERYDLDTKDGSVNVVN